MMTSNDFAKASEKKRIQQEQDVSKLSTQAPTKIQAQNE